MLKGGSCVKGTWRFFFSQFGLVREEDVSKKLN